MKYRKPTAAEIKEENRKMKRVRFIVDLTVALLQQGDLTVMQSLKLVKQTKKFVLSQFPDKGETYDLIYKPRFDRIIRESMAKN